ncbi:hypothetical protein OU787_08485 [Kitasatospora sp. YST-16]|uniref:hypothetical protein n=1 Tax=Kitasatospora sp. YST-16 TaxID=2998080 RepID=UPI002283EC59|nr:hypothetical protein [Kitasatospora sp. YST-16]WAL71535.1 hypothetical protein OU787_08485 [Kitasatospora sp. YST-16]WNW37575.1 hypothetical protein RKE32_08430 [Streptomyces sp. Li-HN-5-13]
MHWSVQRIGVRMASGNDPSFFGNVLASVITATVASVLGAAGLSLRQWRARRNTELKNRRSLDDARARLDYLAQWFTTYATVAPGPEVESMRRWVAACLDTELVALRAVSREERREERMSFWGRMRALLLLHPLHSVAGWIVRVAFYFGLVTVCGVLPKMLSDPRTGWGDRIGASLLLLVLGFGVLAGLWFLAVRLSPRSEALQAFRSDRRPGGGGPDAAR